MTAEAREWMAGPWSAEVAAEREAVVARFLVREALAAFGRGAYRHGVELQVQSAAATFRAVAAAAAAGGHQMDTTSEAHP